MPRNKIYCISLDALIEKLCQKMSEEEVRELVRDIKSYTRVEQDKKTSYFFLREKE